MKTIGVDPDCIELAWHFINDEETRRPMNTDTAVAAVKSLSEAIQSAVEDWFAAQNWDLR
jgi:hypothetical protein